MKFSSFDRQDHYRHLENQQWDLLVIGGGITGAGIALDASARGLKTAVLEMQDFAAGTSSRSTKLVHGGLRYLKQFEVKMVAEVGKEREIVYENGPHVTTPEWMLLPFYKGGTFGPLSTNLGLRVYDFLAGVKKQERRKMLSREETLQREPLLKKEGLKGGGYYVEYKTDDARLTIEVMKKAVEKGALALNYTKVTEFIYAKQKVVGVKVEDLITHGVRNVYAKKIINAAGPWVDILREKDQSKQGKTLHLTKGIHLVFDGKRFPLKQAIYFDMPDGRMAFAIPREGKVYVGTTDTVYKADIAHPTMTRVDRDYVLRAIQFMFPEVGIGVLDIESSWAGLRPLIHEEGKDPSEISRKDEIFISDSGLMSIAGGKLTGYRKMGENIVDKVAEQLEKEQGIPLPKGSTKQLPISGGEVGGSKQFENFRVDREQQAMKLGLNGPTARMLTHRYGANVDQVLAIFSTGREHAEHAALDPLVYAMLRYAMEYEAAYKPVDFFVRRTGALYFNIQWVHVYKEAVISYMAKGFNWSGQQAAAYTEELDKALYEAVTPVEEEHLG
ncbi:glycerol-3-phosphate dehydrogenase/oxidase [Planococcus sp. CP5-4]|uniref:glycerol-3-phosphate dehydrogenase/oxidase n=1 Tax=unclassified Planococcus (in: firmicutes) TaxID=2662419 RepID=UPI001C24FD65|nr:MULTISPECIES: glycerol-3-phosphate dehydrogenase/oxidase [unclassified Planococcus (in: firmicutes)]MBU9673815.1 glycerol-3-phosphate dehydrogenase/oxidase [Planococcus sp. CP5-4_YE]MBV0908943.1 glycerol-3-phosphate dehydrogenase/oxidase [Planococcus sp. CP5-4_UN]MBW6063992.1 glycerol-3-phosphate dehydrogenase/oxidase [Planococcus sp. CP5-4]